MEIYHSELRFKGLLTRRFYLIGFGLSFFVDIVRNTTSVEHSILQQFYKKWYVFPSW